MTLPDPKHIVHHLINDKALKGAMFHKALAEYEDRLELVVYVCVLEPAPGEDCAHLAVETFAYEKRDKDALIEWMNNYKLSDELAQQYQAIVDNWKAKRLKGEGQGV